LVFAAVPLAVIVMPMVRTESRWAFVVLGVVGLVASALAFGLARHIQRAIEALQVAVNVEDLVAGTDSIGAFRRSRRR
jgi:hypothetical protein